MAETPLTDAQADALSGSTDADVDLTYPGIGESPYHTTMYRLLHRMLTLEKVINELRPYKDGDLTFGVRPGAASASSTVCSYAGATGQALTDNATHYVYLTVSGATLVLAVNTTGLPNPATTPHVPLASIATGTASSGGVSGAYDAADLVDLRARSLFGVVGS